MKKSSVLFLLFVLLYSCSNEYDVLDIKTNSANTDVVEDVFKRMGIDTTGIQDCGSYYIVENDIIVSKELLANSELTRSYHTSFYTENHSNITIGVDNETILGNSSWVAALQEVISIYNSKTGLNLSYTTDAPDIVISKTSINSSDGYVGGMGEFPTYSQNYGQHIYINNNPYYGQSLDLYMTHSQKVFLLMHELGHNLGLRHSDMYNRDEPIYPYGAEIVPGTPSNDVFSYMRSFSLFSNWEGLTNYDMLTFRYLWPKYVVSFANSDLANVVFEEAPYYVSRFLIPTKSGFVFAGWHHVNSVYTPFSYDYAITGDKTLYARWSTPTTKVKRAFIISNHYCDFAVQSTYVATLEATINKAMNTWEELSSTDGNLSILYKKNSDNSYTEICRIDFRDYILYPYPVGNTITKSLDIVLDPGDYRMESSITSELGPQTEESFGKQGSVTSSIYW